MAQSPARYALTVAELSATLSAHGPQGELLARIRVASSFKLTADGAAAWVEAGFAKPR